MCLKFATAVVNFRHMRRKISRNKQTSRAIDAVLYGLAVGSLTGMALSGANAGPMLDKPIKKLLDGLDERQKSRELSRLRSYMKTQGLVRGDYEHGIELTAKAHKRIKSYSYNTLNVAVPEYWDRKWRLVMFDVPEEKRESRVVFIRKLQELGYQLLQQSVWIHPFASKEEVYVAARHVGIEAYVTYMSTDYIDNSDVLEKRFRELLKTCS